MTPLARDIRAWMLRSLLSYDGPMADAILKDAVRTRFAGVAFADGDLNRHIRKAESMGLIAGTLDDLQGLIWELTPHGRIRAQQLP